MRSVVQSCGSGCFEKIFVHPATVAIAREPSAKGVTG